MNMLSFVKGWRNNRRSVHKADRVSRTKQADPSMRELHPQGEQLLALFAFLKELKGKDQYIARSDYRKRQEEFSDTLAFFEALEAAGTFEAFCARQGWRSPKSLERIRRILTYGRALNDFVNKENERYLVRGIAEAKDYLDHILDPVDPSIRLDDNQRRVVLSDEDYMLVIAGAGAGKTTTIAAKVRYLVEKKGIAPEKILIVSFTNKAVDELRTRINKNLGIKCPIGTFHATGNTILKKESQEKHNLAMEGTLYRVTEEYLCSTVLEDERAVHDLILFFGTYFDPVYEGRDMEKYHRTTIMSSHLTLKSEMGEYSRVIEKKRGKKLYTLQEELLRSNEEVEIANFLYLNGIDYVYEEIYPYDLPGSSKPYTPDFLITQGSKQVWLEHFGVREDGTNDRYSKEELALYKERANQKYLHHKKHGSRLIFTYSSYLDGRSRMDHLEEKLLAAGFILKPREETEVLARLNSGGESRYIRRLIRLVCRFIENFKANGYEVGEFDRMKQKTGNVRNIIFLSIAKECYIEYQRALKKNNAIDFHDMINESARILRTCRENGDRLDFDYIIVDEYQDISRQRFDLVRALREISDARIIAVGDDWQSIYAFSGSDISLFTNFADKMGYASQMTIDRTYRNSQELIDIAGGFIQKNRQQIRKSLISHKHLEDPVVIFTYDRTLKWNKDDPGSGRNYAMAKCVESALDEIVRHAAEEKRTEKEILLIGRFNFDGHLLEKSGLFEYISYGGRLRSKKYPGLRMTFMTAHASKGLGYDDVMVLNGRNERYGFPSKIEDDPVLKFVVHEDRSVDYAEERRLFYVALTRTKNRVYFIAPEQNPSEFLLELKKDYKTVSLKGHWEEGAEGPGLNYKPCPLCGYPLQLRWKPSYGLRLFICTNDPEICDFMTNDYAGGRLSIRKCDCCRDGFLIVRKAKDGKHFLGCTNYRSDKKGCNNTKSA